MPTIYDNITEQLAEGLREHLPTANSVDFCVGYFNLRGWKDLADGIDVLEGRKIKEGKTTVHRTCRLLVGMQRMPIDALRLLQRRKTQEVEIDIDIAQKIKRQLAEDFRKQLTQGTPNNADEQGLQQLLGQLKSGKVAVRLFMRHALHAKLYLIHSPDTRYPTAAFMGSSNLTFSGLVGQGELNIDVLDKDAAAKLREWFDARWVDDFCWDISDELISVIEESWAGLAIRSPYHIYLKILYHLAREARLGINEFKLPKIFETQLLPFQAQAVQIAAHHIHKRGGVLLGDVVGLGKTITATAIAKLFEDFQYNTLIICPPNLIPMWEHYKYTYKLHAKIISIGSVQKELKNIPPYQLVIIDESHNLRNREGSRYAAIRTYLEQHKSKVVLLSATPYNKSYIDLANQLRLFIPDDMDLGVTPERYIESVGGSSQFNSKHTETFIRSIKAFELSQHSDDWRELMRLFLVRRTRGFIRQYHAQTDETNQRKFLTFADGSRSYFPDRIPRKIAYRFDLDDHSDQYAQLYSESVVDILNNLQLPRYGLANFIAKKPTITLTKAEEMVKENLSRAGKRLMGFCRTNLFKRLESSGFSFLLSLSRHVLRNAIFIHAIDHNLPLPIGNNNIDLDSYIDDMEQEELSFDDQDNANSSPTDFIQIPYLAIHYAQQAHNIYTRISQEKQKKMQWIRPQAFSDELRKTLSADSSAILSILQAQKGWNAKTDKQLNALHELCTKEHSDKKILLFTQYSDTAHYLYEQLKNRGIKGVGCVTGSSTDPTDQVRRFSPVSNNAAALKNTEQELRILIATDVLSEGQNLQDAHIIVNYDLPWAIIRLIQRAGRVDRIGQQAAQIFCYAFLPEDGIEKIISLRQRLQQRIRENAEVVGSDEVFFDGDPINISDLYSEKSGVLDDADDDEIDLASYAFQLWKTATDNNPELLKIIPRIQNVVAASKTATAGQTKGAIIYTRTRNDNDVLVWLDQERQTVTHSQWQILKALACTPNTAAFAHEQDFYSLQETAVDLVDSEEHKYMGGALGSPKTIKNRVYNLLLRFDEQETIKNPLFQNRELRNAMDDIYNYPLKETAKDILQRQLKTGISDSQLAELVLTLRETKQLSIINHDDTQPEPPQIICAMGLI